MKDSKFRTFIHEEDCSLSWAAHPLPTALSIHKEIGSIIWKQ